MKQRCKTLITIMYFKIISIAGVGLLQGHALNRYLNDLVIGSGYDPTGVLISGGIEKYIHLCISMCSVLWYCNTSEIWSNTYGL